MKKTTLVLMTAIAFLGGCGDSEKEANEAPQAKYPYTPPPLDENPPMSSSQIDQINEEVTRNNQQ